MSFQWIIDNCTAMAIDSRRTIASTTARDGTSRTVSRGGGAWTFEVQMPEGIPYREYRQNIALAEEAYGTQSSNISLNATGHDWLVEYQGDSANYTGFVADVTEGSDVIQLTTSPTTTSGYKFRAGDYIQLGATGSVYQVAADVAYTSNTVTLHRPVLNDYATSVSSQSLRVAEDCVWNVTLVSFPKWTLSGTKQVSWDGPFVFVENLV